MKGRRLAILSLDFYPDPGGVQTYLYEIALRLDSSFRVTVLTSAKGELPPYTPFEKIQLSHGTARHFRSQLRTMRPDFVLVGHAHPQMLVAAALSGRYAALAYGNDFLAAQARWHRPLFNRLLRHAEPLITISRANQARLDRLGITVDAVVLPGTDPARFTPPETPVAEPVLLTVGRLVSRKGHRTVLHTLPRLRRHFLGLRYLVAGVGPERPRLEALAVELGVRDAVDFLGHVPEDGLPALYRRAAVFVMPVRAEAASVEGFGIVFLEASACGLPVVAGGSGGAAEAVRAEDTGLIVPPDDPDSLGDALLRLLGDPEMRSRMGQSGRKWVESEMNWDRAAAEIAAALK